MIKKAVALLVFTVFLSCGQTTTPAVKIPVAGGPLAFSSVAVTNGKATVISVYWPPASDEETASASLQYKLVLDTNSAANIDTIAEVNSKTGNDIAMDWTAAATNCTVTNIDGDKSYYFNVIVRDGDGNMTAYTPRRLGEVSGTASFFYTGSTNYTNIAMTLSNSSLVYSNSGSLNCHIRSVFAGTYRMFTYVFIYGLSTGIGLCKVSTNGSDWISLSSSSNFQAWVNVVPQVISNIFVTVADDESQTYDFYLNGY